MQGDQFMKLLTRVLKLTGLIKSQSQIVAVVVSLGVDLLCTFQERDGAANLSILDIELAKIVICIVAVRLQLDYSLELEFSFIGTPKRKKVRSECRSRFRYIGPQENCLLKEMIGLLLLTLRN